MGVCSRREVKEYCKNGRIRVNERIVKVSDIKIDVEKDYVFFDDSQVLYEKYEYYMLNKPAGVVSATNDNTCKTVIDLIESSSKKNLFPVGRLDKDTVGLLLITNDGDFAHKLLAPNKHVPKTYYVKAEGKLNAEHIKMCEEGIRLEEDFITKPSILNIISCGEISEAELTIYEGKFHQVKRMMAAMGCRVVYLKRIRMGSVTLDDNLLEGEFRRLTDNEINKLQQMT